LKDRLVLVRHEPGRVNRAEFRRGAKVRSLGVLRRPLEHRELLLRHPEPLGVEGVRRQGGHLRVQHREGRLDLGPASGHVVRCASPEDLGPGDFCLGNEPGARLVLGLHGLRRRGIRPKAGLERLERFLLAR